MVLGLGVYKGDDPTQQGSGLAWPHHQLERQDRAGEQQSGSMRDRKGTWAGRIKKLKSKLDSFSRQRFRCQWQEDHGEGPAEHMAASSFHPPAEGTGRRNLAKLQRMEPVPGKPGPPDKKGELNRRAALVPSRLFLLGQAFT